MNQILRSIVLSILASVIGTYLLQRVVPAAGGTPPAEADGGAPSSANVNVNVVVMPIVIGNVWAIGAPRAMRKFKRFKRKLRH